MKCNPWRWLIGILPIVLLSWVAMLGERERIETDLTDRARKTLDMAGLGWASIGMEGRDAVLSGTAFEDGEPLRAARLVEQTYGVRIVANKAALIDKADRYDWSAAKSNGRVRLAGVVPNDQMRREILGIAKASFPTLEIDDRLKLARGAPQLDTWLGGVGFGLKQLAQLKQGRVQLETTNLSVSGEAIDADTYRAVKTALATGMPTGITLKSDQVEPPIIKPYVWSAILDKDQLRIAGSVPSEKGREHILTIARRAMPKVKTTDRMEPGRGEPEAFAEVATAITQAFGRLEFGQAELRDQVLTITGTTQKEATADELRKTLRQAVPAAYRIIDRISFREPTIRPVTPYVTSAVLDRNVLVLSGYVPDATARANLLQAATRYLGTARLQDQLQPGAGQPAGWLRCLDVGLSALARLGNGRLGLVDRVMQIEGSTSDEKLASTLAAEVRTAANRDCDVDVKVQLNVRPEPRLRWTARMPDRGTLELSGEVAGENARRELAALAAKLLPNAAISDTTTVSGSGSEKWIQTATVALTQLVKLRHGEARVVHDVLRITGEARDVVTHTTIKDALTRSTPAGYRSEEAIVVRSDVMIAAEEQAKRKAEDDARRALADAQRKVDEEARAKAEEEATAARRRAEDDARLRAEADARRRAEEDARRRAADEARRRSEEEARLRAEAEARRRAEEEARLRAEADARQRADDAARSKAEEADRLRVEAEARRRAAEDARLKEQPRAPEVDACQAALRRVSSEGVILFARARAELDRRSFQTLDLLVTAIRTCPDVRVEIEGHTDSDGTTDRNQRLSEARAQSVADYLIKAGIDEQRLTTVGYGESRPVARNNSAANKALNRRIEFTVKTK